MKSENGRRPRIPGTPWLVRVVILVLFFPSITLTSFLSCSSQNNKQEVVRVGWLPIFYGLPHFVALEQGLYEKHGLIVESIQFSTSNDLADALAAGRVDVGSPVALSVVLALEGRNAGLVKLLAIYATAADRPTDYLLVRADSTIASIADLKGKRIGTFPGSTMRLYARLGLAPDLSLPGDAELIELQPDLQLAALMNKQIDALLTYDADAVYALANADLKVIAKGIKSRIMDPFPSGGLVFSSRFLESNPGSAQNVRKAIIEAIQVIELSPADAKKSGLAFLPSLTDEIVEQLQLPTYQVAPNIDVTLVKKFESILRDDGQLQAPVDVSQMVYKD